MEIAAFLLNLAANPRINKAFSANCIRFGNPCFSGISAGPMIWGMANSLPLHKLKPADLPAPPQAALQMLQACSVEDVDQRLLVQFAETDPVLTAEVLRVVNTPLFGIGKEVMSVRHAISLLGIRALRSIVLCLMVRDAVQGQQLADFNLTEFWEDTLRRATAAKAMAQYARLNPDECFTLGMLQDFGVLLLFYLHPGIAGEYSSLRRLDPDACLAREQEIFATSHVEIIGLLAQAWSLPRDLVEAIVSHHQPEENMQAELLYCADWVNAVFTASNINATFDRARHLLEARLGLAPDAIQELFAGLPQSVEESARVMGLHIPTQVNFETLLRQANSRLAEDNMSYQELTWQLEKAIAERDRLTRELNDEIALAREVQRRLMPACDNQSLPIHGINKPARNISGDFFDFIENQHGHLWFILGDVSGKGINAGMLMAKTASLFRCLAKHMSDPLKLVQIINNEICETSTRGYFVTMVVGIYSAEQQSVRLVNAGHLPVLIMDQAGTPRLLPAVDPPAGILPNISYALSEAISLQNKSLYLYSDGVTESLRPDEQMLEIDGLIKLIQAHAGQPAMQRLSNMVTAMLPASQLHDDITLLLLEP